MTAPALPYNVGNYFRRLDSGSKTRIPNTGLHVTFTFLTEFPTIDVSIAWQMEWRRFWHAWVKNNRPLPIKSLSAKEEWFYARANGSPNFDADLARRFDQDDFRLTMVLMISLTFMVYGGLHLLAWQYNFNSTSELHLWRISAVITTSTGVVLMTLSLAGISMKNPVFAGSRLKRATFGNPRAERRFYHWVTVGLRLLSYLLVLLNIASRAFLVIESFKALPNSPRSTYTIPSWAAYIPHI